MDPLIGQITMFAGNFAPRGWAFCEGQLLAISSHSALFSILGTTYGGDGRTTFALPDLRGRSPIQQGRGPGLPTYSLGQKGGNYEVMLTNNQLPSHDHIIPSLTGVSTIPCVEDDAGESEAAGNNLANADGTNIYSTSAADGTLKNGGSVTTNQSVTSRTGAQQSFNTMNPFLGINYIIALVGVFPSRS